MHNNRALSTKNNGKVLKIGFGRNNDEFASGDEN